MAIASMIAAAAFIFVWLRRLLTLLPTMKNRYVSSKLVDYGMGITCALPLVGGFYVLRTNQSETALVLTLLGIVCGGAVLAIGAEREFRSVKKQ